VPFIRVTNCSIRVSRSFTERLPSLCPPSCYTYMIVIMKYTILWHSLIVAGEPTSKQSHRAPHLCIYRLKRRFAMFNLLCSSTNQLLFKKNFCNQSSHYENYGQIYGSHHVPTTKSTLFVVNKDEWYTKEGRGKSMKDALYVQWYGKKHLSGWSNVEQQKKIRPVALAIVELCESEASGRQAVSQSVENSVK